MGQRRWLHAFAVVACAIGVADGQPAPGTAPQPTEPAAKPPVPAGSSAVESSDVPDWRPSPPRFVVAPFENYSGSKALDWLVAGAPFEIVEKTEEVFGLEPVDDHLRVGGTRILPEPEPVAALAAASDATYAITGWVDRPNWNLRIAITLWKVTRAPGKPAQAVVIGETQRTGDSKAYHQLLGDALGEVWVKGVGAKLDDARVARLRRSLARDLYAVNLMSRGLGYLVGLFGAVNLKAAEKDLEKAVFIDPKCAEAQRLVGELYLIEAADPKAPPRLASKAAGKFAYAADLAPDNLAVLRAAALAAKRAGKHEVARDALRKLVTRKPWDLEARYEYGAALWNTGDADAAAKQLHEVTAHRPDHLPARRVLALIHASRGDTSKLVGELEAIAVRAPTDLEVKADLATAYGAIARWDRAAEVLEQIAAVRPHDLALAVRLGDAYRRLGQLDRALGWYARGQRIAPDSGMPGFLAAQALFDAGRLAEAVRGYLGLQRHDLASAEHALGAIALIQHRPDDAAWYLRRAVKGAPRVLAAWRSLAAAELARKDPAAALAQLERALPTWPDDGVLHYLAGVAHAMVGDKEQARRRLNEALERAPALVEARAALGQLNAGGTVTLAYKPELVRPWGDRDAIVAALDRFAAASTQMAAARGRYQHQFLQLLGALGEGPLAPVKRAPVRTCPVDRIAPLWASAQRELTRYERAGVELEAAYRFIARHDDAGATAALLPNARAQVAADRKAFKVALADVAELRAEWARGLVPELRHVGCTDRLLAAAIKYPERYRVAHVERPDAIPPTEPPRPRPRATFYVDNTSCPDAVDVWIDGTRVGQVAPGRRGALIADAGERALCLIVPGSAQCGDRGTLRQVYLHDGWAATMHCPE